MRQIIAAPKLPKSAVDRPDDPPTSSPAKMTKSARDRAQKTLIQKESFNSIIATAAETCILLGMSHRFCKSLLAVSFIIASPLRASPAQDEQIIAPSASSGEREFVRAIRRQSYGEALQARLLEEGREAIVIVTGQGYRTLRIVAAEMTKQIADNYRGDQTAIAKWRELGFDLLELTDGQGASWSLQMR